MLVDVTKDAQQARVEEVEWEDDAAPLTLPGYAPLYEGDRTVIGEARSDRGGLLVALAGLLDSDVRDRLAAERIVAKDGKPGERRQEQAKQHGQRLQCRKRQSQPTLAARCRFLSERGAQIVGRLSHELFFRISAADDTTAGRGGGPRRSPQGAESSSNPEPSCKKGGS